jgi:uncharacterized tellurite resistance protein B-like protein
MIAKLKQFIQSHAQESSPEDKQRHLHLAVATLLQEVVYADKNLTAAEAALLPEMLINTLRISTEEALTLVDAGKKSRKNATSLFDFTTKVNAQFSVADKQKLLLSMWQLAYADGELSQYEDQIIRRTADLLYLKHSELIQMRNIAIDTR